MPAAAIREGQKERGSAERERAKGAGGNSARS